MACSRLESRGIFAKLSRLCSVLVPAAVSRIDSTQAADSSRTAMSSRNSLVHSFKSQMTDDEDEAANGDEDLRVDRSDADEVATEESDGADAREVDDADSGWADAPDCSDDASSLAMERNRALVAPFSTASGVPATSPIAVSASEILYEPMRRIASNNSTDDTPSHSDSVADARERYRVGASAIRPLVKVMRSRLRRSHLALNTDHPTVRNMIRSPGGSAVAMLLNELDSALDKLGVDADLTELYETVTRASRWRTMLAPFDEPHEEFVMFGLLQYHLYTPLDELVFRVFSQRSLVPCFSAYQRFVATLSRDHTPWCVELAEKVRRYISHDPTDSRRHLATLIDCAYSSCVTLTQSLALAAVEIHAHPLLLQRTGDVWAERVREFFYELSKTIERVLFGAAAKTEKHNRPDNNNDDDNSDGGGGDSGGGDSGGDDDDDDKTIVTSKARPLRSRGRN